MWNDFLVGIEVGLVEFGFELDFEIKLDPKADFQWILILVFGNDLC